MKRIESVKLSGLNGERVDVVTFARWKKQIAGIEFSFALHLLPSFKVGMPNKLWISEVGTGFNTLVVVKHPVSGQHMTDAMALKFSQGFVVKLAKSALHNTLNRCGDSAFVNGLVRAEMLLLAKQQYQRETDHAAQVNCEACEDTGFQAEKGPEGELRAVECQVCLDSKVVSTTDTDHEGQPIEARCPECVEKNGGLKGGTFQVSGTLTETYRNQAALDKLVSADFGKLESEYVPSPQEIAQAEADADAMNQNMAKYGTIDAPAGDLLHHDTELTEADLPRLRQRRDEVQIRMDQHGTMTGDTSEQGYESLSDELDELNQHIANLEDSPCSK